MQNRDVPGGPAVISGIRLFRCTNAVKLERCCDHIAERAAARGMTEYKLAAILQDDE